MLVLFLPMSAFSFDAHDNGCSASKDNANVEHDQVQMKIYDFTMNEDVVDAIHIERCLLY